MTFKVSEMPVTQKMGNTGAAPSASRNWDFAYTWNSGGTTFTADFMNITDTASAAASLLFDRQLGGTSRFSIGKTQTNFGSSSVAGVQMGAGAGTQGAAATPYLIFGTYTGTGWYLRAANVWSFTASGTASLELHGGGLRLGPGVLGFGTGVTSDDVGQARKAAGVMENNNGTKGSYTGSAFGSGSQTVAQLPAAATAGKGARSFVTDASATTFLSTVAGGGANNVPVVSDGTNWLIG